MRNHESRENYLETILILKDTIGEVRSVDIANKLDFSKASISKAMTLLKKENMIEIDDNGHIDFTKKGQQEAEKIYERHRIIFKLLKKLGVSEENADNDACRIEHIISDETFEALKKLLFEKN